MKNKKNMSWFTLVEVMVATSILMLSVFWVYKLIWENAKLINNNDNYVQLNSLFLPLESCIEKIWYDGFWDKTIWKVYDFDFWNSQMNWCTNSSLSWIIILDNLEYYLSSTVLQSWVDFMDFETKIFADWVWSYTWSYKLIK